MNNSKPRQCLPLDKRIGNKIRVRRINIGLSQADLAKALGVSFQQVQKYERGINRVGAGRLSQIAELLKVSPEFFFDETSNAIGLARTDAMLELIKTEPSQRLLRAFNEIDSVPARNAVLELVESFAAICHDKPRAPGELRQRYLFGSEEDKKGSAATVT